jgi:YjbE family integral membrane protein
MQAMDLALPVAWLPLPEIIWIDLLLSGDNAVVVALACRALPERQRTWGILLGSGAAIALRAIFTLLVVELLDMPFVKIAGGVLLLWIAIKLAGGEASQNQQLQPAVSLGSAIRMIVVADAVMSLDNIMAIAAAAKGSELLILFGLALSIPLIIFGSTLVMALFNRFPVLIWAGAALLGWIAGDLLSSDPVLTAWLRPRWPDFDIWDGPAGAAFVAMVAWLGHWRAAARKLR